MKLPPKAWVGGAVAARAKGIPGVSNSRRRHPRRGGRPPAAQGARGERPGGGAGVWGTAAATADKANPPPSGAAGVVASVAGDWSPPDPRRRRKRTAGVRPGRLRPEPLQNSRGVAREREDDAGLLLRLVDVAGGFGVVRAAHEPQCAPVAPVDRVRAEDVEAGLRGEVHEAQAANHDRQLDFVALRGF